MAEYFYFGRPKLPRGYSYPMKRGELDRILDASQVVSVTSVAFCGCPDDHRVLEANYWGPRRKHAEHGLQLWICAVSSQERHVVHDTLLEKVFPVLVTWIKTFDSLATTLSQTDHSIRFFIRDGNLDVQRE
jgi:hypothetical protein